MIKIANETAEIVSEVTDEGIAVRLLKATSGVGIVWVWDMDAERTYEITKYPTFARAEAMFAAEKAYRDVMRQLVNFRKGDNNGPETQVQSDSIRPARK